MTARATFEAADREAVAAAAAGLAEAEFALPGHFVADLTATIDGDALAIDVLTAED